MCLTALSGYVVIRNYSAWMHYSRTTSDPIVDGQPSLASRALVALGSWLGLKQCVS